MLLKFRWCFYFACCCLWIGLIGEICRAEDVSPALGQFLQAGKLTEAAESLHDQLKANPQQHQSRFALGVVHVLSALEHLGQDQYRYGALSGRVRAVPILRLPVPINPNPETVTYSQVRQIFEDFQRRIITAENELALVDVQTDVKLLIDLGAIQLDLNGDGQATEQESFASVLRVANRQRPGTPVPDLKVAFDAGDVPWLRGYCHFLCAMCDMVLAYDHQEMFDATAQWIYPRHVPSKPVLGEPLDLNDVATEAQIMDAVAAIHLAKFPVREPQRMAQARLHLLEMIRTSRESWTLIQAESDDDREWLPNPRQTGVLQMPVRQDQIDGWHNVLQEMEDLLEGRKLVPFWRDSLRAFEPSLEVPQAGRGVNLKRFFDEPREFDLVLLFQGTAVLPYLERGPLSHPDTWRNLTRVFDGQFFGFAVWFN